MLKREDSDFQWFKSRTEALYSSLTSEYSKMAASTVPLNSETSQPNERAEHDLPPKSYADVVFNTKNETNEQSDANDHNASGANGDFENYAGPSIAGSVNGFPPPNHETAKPANQLEIPEDTIDQKKSEKDKVLFEKHDDDMGNHLTSVKPGQGHEKWLEHDRETRPRGKEMANTTQIEKKHDGKSHLASGRRAGAGWERSA